ncbi:MAG: hypothetical protein HN583_06905 [Kordiimonadaceae bacterium]|jgi:hypothetical protein|nr:hypothetical protein [Kordiimonadaceae bacterium]MDC0081625.1 hypothetical protein [Emcibacteraceae bacterium]MBT6134364.1 hypothetical protein [Kordiimonadaceae bacterium]MBT7544263.1 hypothetical protein [Kordiimonadaceae bacterium]MBT7605396.1 hypothetical protein [Kordiimonadaceae bacterium]|tara:strand:- start:21151 stop:21579 length:429 start_codon:yes stop_codon:yes gene_type:complete
MKNNFKSKIIVISFFAFVVSIYSASYFYTKNNNERLLASPRIVMLVGAEAEKNDQLLELTDDQRRDDIRLLNAEKKLFVLSQTQFNDGITDIIEYYAGQYIGEKLTVADCMDYSEKLERAMIKTENKALKSSWIFSACGLIP